METTRSRGMTFEQEIELKKKMTTKKIRCLFWNEKTFSPKYDVELSNSQVAKMLKISLNRYDSFQRIAILKLIRDKVGNIRKIAKKDELNFIDPPYKNQVAVHGFNNKDAEKTESNIEKYDGIETASSASADLTRKVGQKQLKKISSKRQNNIHIVHPGKSAKGA